MKPRKDKTAPLEPTDWRVKKESESLELDQENFTLYLIIMSEINTILLEVPILATE